jgi:type IV secretion system protein VirB10
MTDGTQRAPEVTPDLRLRAERPRVTRLSRKALIGLGGAVGLAVAAALIYALQTRRGDQAAKELYTTENRTTAEGVTALPRDYTGIPRLGPPLPGDLGRPILNAQNQGQPVPLTGPLPQPGVTPEEQRRLQEIEAARLSKLFASTEFRATPSLPATAAANATSGTTLAVPAEAPPLDPNSMQNMQDRKLAFVNGPVDRRTVSAVVSRIPRRPMSCRPARSFQPR